MFNIEELPTILNDFNYIKKEEKGCLIYSYSPNNNILMIIKSTFEVPFDICVDKNTLNMLIVLAPANIQITDTNFIIKSEKGTFKSALLEKNYYIKEYNFVDSININSKILKLAANFVNKKDYKPILTGVNINEDGNIYATDAISAFKFTNNIQCVNNITIPSNFAIFIDTIKKGEDVELKFNQFYCGFEDNNVTYISPLLVDKFPKIDKLFENEENDILEFNKNELNDKINIALNMQSDNLIIKIKNDEFIAKTELNFYNSYFNSSKNFKEYEMNFDLTRFKNIIDNILLDDIKINYKDLKSPLKFSFENCSFILSQIRS